MRNDFRVQRQTILCERDSRHSDQKATGTRRTTENRGFERQVVERDKKYQKLKGRHTGSFQGVSSRQFLQNLNNRKHSKHSTR